MQSSILKLSPALLRATPRRVLAAHSLSSTSIASRTIRNMSVATTHGSLKAISTPLAPAAVGPYSQAIKVGTLLFTSGSLGIDPATGKLVPGGVEEQARQALKNLQAVIEAGGGDIGRVAKTTVFIKSMDDFKACNAIYEGFFGSHKPARSCVEVARLPLDSLFEIECIVNLA